MSARRLSGLATLCVSYRGEPYEGNGHDVAQALRKALKKAERELAADGVEVTEVHVEDLE